MRRTLIQTVEPTRKVEIVVKYRESRFMVLGACAAAVVWLSACSGSDTRTERLQPGISRDSALSILGSSAPSDSANGAAMRSGGDSLKNVWRKAQYRVNGNTIEIILYSPGNDKGRAADSVPKGRVIPVVVIDGKVMGVGRTTYDQVVDQYKLPKNKY